MNIFERMIMRLALPFNDPQASLSVGTRYEELMRSQWFDVAQLEQLQERKLGRLLQRVRATVPFYAAFEPWAAAPGAGLRDRLASLPILTKEKIRQRPAEPAERRMQWYFAASHPAFLEAKQAVARLRSLNATAMYGTASSLQSRARHALVPSVVAIAAAFLLTVLFTYLIDLFVIAPIRRLTVAVRGVKDSEAPVDADLASRDEVWELQEAVRDALAKRDRTGDEP